MPAIGKPLGRAISTADFSTKDTNYTLTTRLEVCKALNSDKRTLSSALWFEARFSLRQDSEARGKNVGHVYAYKVDKTVSAKDGTPLWLSEILADSDDAVTSELRLIMQELYDPAGNVQSQLAKSAAKLQGESIVFVDTLMLVDSMRGTGLSKLAMEEFHGLLPQLSKSFDFTGTVVLSPAPSSDFRGSSMKSDVEIEKALIKLYTSVGYKVLKKGDERVDNSVTVMGAVLE